MSQTAPLAAILGDDVLLTTKFYAPRPRPNFVARPRLVARLTQALSQQQRLTVIAAPPGFGKTTLLSEWLQTLAADQPAVQVAWLSLDSSDNEPRRFFVYSLAALQTVRPALTERLLAARNRQPGQPPTPRTLLKILINQMAAAPEPLVFVLDDFHLIESAALHQELTFLLENLPPQVQLVIAGRGKVPFSLARLRAGGQLTELHGPDLRFTPAEVAAFFRQTMALELTSAQLSLLEDRTEGWVAGLQLAALSLQGRAVENADALAQTFSGSHRYVLDYLLTEVLHQQPPHLQRFLLETSILERLCGPLCDAVRDVSGDDVSDDDKTVAAQRLLETLEQANLFIVPLDSRRRWYRYHHLFAELLQHRLAQQSPPEAISRLHRRASQWYEQAGLDTEAMRHALAAVDSERVIRLARHKAAGMLSRTEQVTLLSWLDALPAGLTRSRPGLSLLNAWAMVLTGQLESMEAYLAEAAQSDAIQGEILTLRAGVAYLRRDMAQAVALCRAALAHLPDNNPFLRGIVLQITGAAYSWQGEVTAAVEAFAEASAISQIQQSGPVQLVSVWNLGQLHIEQGLLGEAARIFSHQLAQITPLPAQPQPSTAALIGRLHLGLAQIFIEQNRLEAATEQLQQGLALGQTAQDSGTLTSGQLLLARLRHAEGDIEAALAAVQEGQTTWPLVGEPHYWGTRLAVYRARLWLAQGNVAAATEWVQAQGLLAEPLPKQLPYLREEEYLMAARLLRVRARREAATAGESLALADEILRRLIEAATAGQRLGRRLEALLQHALLARQQNQEETARHRLAEALELAEPAGYVRLFIAEVQDEADGPLPGLLQWAARQEIAPDYVADLLAAAPTSKATAVVQPPELVEPLSERELELLALMATGMSNKELAEALVLTVGTVKWHLNNIYGKLAVRNRTEAVARARELGLLLD